MTVDNAITETAARTEALHAANAEFVRVIGTCTDEAWGRVCEEEGWTVAVVVGGAFGPGGSDRVTVARFAGSRGHLDRHFASIQAALAR